MCEIIDFLPEERLGELSPLGARMGSHAYRNGEKLPMVYVSTVVLNGGLYTRVEHHEGAGDTPLFKRVHFKGDLDTRKAAALYWGDNAY